MKKIKFLSRRKWLFLGIFLVLGTLAFREPVNRFFEIGKNIEIFTTIYKDVNNYYVDEVDPGKLMRTGLDAMLKTLDPYTNYIAESQIEEYRIKMTGRFGGIGANYHLQDDEVVISSLLEGFPAAKAGLKPGDKILSIDGKPTKGKKVDEVKQFIDGAPGSSVELKIEKNNGKKESLTIDRAEVKIPNVPYKGMIREDIGYVTLTTFTMDAGKNVATAIQDLKKDNKLKGLVFDLRGNGGGLLREAVNVSNIFVPKNEEIVSTRGKVKEWDKHFKTLNDPIDEEIPLVVLIDKNSASASEIVSGVIQDLDRGVLIGQKSFGKGLVQNTRDVGFKSKVKLTTAKYYIPSGRCIQSVNYRDGKPADISDSLRTEFKTKNGRSVYDGGGVMPDIKVKDVAENKLVDHLIKGHWIFKYAVNYAEKNASITNAKNFTLSDADFQDFKTYIKKEGYNYASKSEKVLERLEKKAEKENYDNAIKTDLETTRRLIAQEKEKELNAQKEVVIDLLEKEIAAMYYYEKGKIEIGLRNDAEIQEALKIFDDKPRYEGILKGSK